MPHKQPFIDLIKSKFDTTKPLKGIEIGCYEGALIKMFLEQIPTLDMTTIDVAPIYQKIVESSLPFMQRLRILHCESDEAVPLIKGQVDFVYIDGDHSYEQCKKDIINYLPLVRSGGILAGHNYHKKENSAHPGVHLSVDEIFGDKVKLLFDFTWYVEIP